MTDPYVTAQQVTDICSRLDRIAEALEKIAVSLAMPPDPPVLDPRKIDWEGHGTDAARRARWYAHPPTKEPETR